MYKMAPSKCSYFHCNNTRKDVAMFRFPSSDSHRLEIWLKRCGNMTITHLSKEDLRNKYLCIAHFDRKFIIKTTGQRKRISRYAIPKHYAEDEDPPSPIPSTSQVQDDHNLQSPPVLQLIKPKKTYSRLPLHTETVNEGESIQNSQNNPSITEELKVLTPRKKYSRQINKEIETEDEGENKIFFETPQKRKRKTEEDTPKCKRMKLAVQNSKKVTKKWQLKYQRLQKKIKKSKKNKYNSKCNKSETRQTIINMFDKKPRTKWTDKEKKMCMTIYYQSPATYKLLRRLGFPLAAPTTIQNWLQESNCLAGLNDDVFLNIKIKFADQSIKDKFCTVCFDEMSIKVDLEYTKKYDLVEGFEDFGGGERAPKEAKYALVFVARGMYNKWKIPLAYFLSNKNVNSEKLKLIIKSVINKLFSCGLLPKVVICDQATTNVKAIKALGASKDYPFFFIDDHKLFAIFDVPHLIKNIRNNLLDHNYILNGNEISFNDIINVYNIDKNNKSKSLKKLTPVHLAPNNFQKMKVKLATQVLSHSVAAAMETAIDSGEIKSDTAKHTADFIQNMNDLFDTLNSKKKFDKNPFKCAITKDPNSIVRKTLIKGREIMKNLKKIIIKNNKKQLKIPPCFEGFQHTINAVLQLSDEEFSRGTEVNFMPTYRLNQDVIENLFGIYRMRGGCNRNPTSKNLRAIFRSNLINNLMKLENTNCDADHDTFLSLPTTEHDQPQNIPLSLPETASRVLSNAPTTPPSVPETATPGPSNAPVSCRAPTSHLIEGELSENTEVTLETCSVVYFAGWLGKVCIEKFDCSSCKAILINNDVDLTDRKQLLLINKTYSNLMTPTLKSPSDFLYELVNQMLDVFKNSISMIHSTELVSRLTNDIIAAINLSNNYHDASHMKFLINKLLEVKIYDYCKTKKKTFNDTKSKLRILQNR